MRDIRKPYRNLNTKQLDAREKNILREVEKFEDDDYPDLEFDGDGVTVMKAASHFGVDGIGKKSQSGYDILKRDNYFSTNKRPNLSSRVDPGKKLKNKNKWKLILFLILISGLAYGIYAWTYIYNSVLITVSPKYKNIDIDDTFEINVADLRIASSTEVVQKTIPKSFPKEISSKANGMIIIYNNYSNANQKFVKNTRFKIKDGKIFRITESVIIPGKSGKTPGSIKVRVFADTYGAEYNIPPSDFTIPSLKGTSKYNSFYAKSVTKMTGGASGTVTTVAPEDIIATKKDLTAQNSQKLATYVKNIKYPGYISLVDSPIYNHNDNVNDLANGKSNNYILNSNVKVIFIKDSLLASILTKKVMGSNNLNDDLNQLRLNDASLLKFTLPNNINLQQNATMTILISGKAQIVWDYNSENIKSILVTKGVKDFSEIMKTYANILSSQSYELNPFWQKYFPNDIRRIEIKEVIQ